MMKKMVIFLALGLVATAAWAADENLAKNPGFEEDGNWSPYGTGPGLKSEDQKVIVQYDETEFHSGKRSLRSSDVTTDFRPYAIQFIRIEKGEYSQFKLSVFAKGVKGENFRIGLAFMEVEGKERRFIKNDFKELKQPTDWTEFTFEFNNVPTDSNEVCIILAPSGAEATEISEVLFDDVVLTGTKTAQ